MTQAILNSLAVTIAALTILWVVILIRRMLKLNVIFNHAIVLIPLYHKKTWLIILNTLLLLFAFAAVILGFLTRHYTIFTSLLTVILSLIALVTTMLAGKFAVLDSGIIVPFRFIDFMHLYEFKIEGNKIFFCRDNKGYDTISSITPNLTFSIENLSKLEYLLNKHINKH